MEKMFGWGVHDDGSPEFKSYGTTLLNCMNWNKVFNFTATGEGNFQRSYKVDVIH